MARQTGSCFFEGTIDDVRGYKMYGKYYLRTKSSLDRKTVLTDKRFFKTRENAKWFGEAQKIAAEVYRELLLMQRDRRNIWYPLRNKAQQMIREGVSREAIIDQLRNEFVVPQKKKQ